MSTKLFDFTLLTTNPVPNGGIPIFSPDLLQMQTNLMQYSSLLWGYSCVLSGCLIYNVNKSNSTCSVTAGYIKINEIVYRVEQTTGINYPFAFIPSSIIPDIREFFSADDYQVATTYSYGIKANWNFTSNEYPTDLTTSMIYFDPFTAQRAEYIFAANSRRLNSLEFIAKNHIVSKDELGNSIAGGNISIRSNNGNLKWAYYGFNEIISNDTLPSTQYPVLGITNFSGAVNTTVGSTSNTLTLVPNNIPYHSHPAGSLSTDTQGNHNHVLQTEPGKDDETFDNGNRLSPADTGISGVFPQYTDAAGAHQHNISGSTGNNVTTNEAINIKNLTLNMAAIKWCGYSNSEILTNIIGYQFWTQAPKYNNM